MSGQLLSEADLVPQRTDDPKNQLRHLAIIALDDATNVVMDRPEPECRTTGSSS
jgi:hypothetical protein